jgi:hypothetical protein
MECSRFAAEDNDHIDGNQHVNSKRPHVLHQRNKEQHKNKCHKERHKECHKECHTKEELEQTKSSHVCALCRQRLAFSCPSPHDWSPVAHLQIHHICRVCLLVPAD